MGDPSPPLPAPERAAAATGTGQRELPKALPSPDELASDFEVVSGSELVQRIRASRAPATLVNAWASWCGPCRREFPMLVELEQQLAAKGVALLFVSMDEDSSRANALTFAAEHGRPSPLLIAARPLGEFKRSLHQGWPGMLPATFLFDAEGRLRHFWGGEVYREELLPVLQDFLSGKPVDGETRFSLTPGRDFRGEPTVP